MPLEVYHGVPAGWYSAEIIAAHKALGGEFSISGSEATEPGAPSWMPERNEWLQYRATLYRVANGVRADDPACVELAVRFIELRYIGSYSGYIRERLARALKSANLTDVQAVRLDKHFRGLLVEREHTVEFREFFPLWRAILPYEPRVRVVEEFAGAGDKTKQWLSHGLQPNEQ